MFKAFYELVDGSVKQLSDIRDIIFGVFKETRKVLIQKTSGNLRKMFSVDEIEDMIDGHYSDLIDWLKSHGARSMDPDDNRVAKAINKFVFN